MVPEGLPWTPSKFSIEWIISGVGETLDKDTIAKLRKEISELKDNFERERKDIEQSYKLEIAAIEAKHDEEKGEILKNIEKDKVSYQEALVVKNMPLWKHALAIKIGM